MRKPKTLLLHIPKPCHENWESMTPTEQGRFCLSCEKEVVSFTNQTEAQIVAYFKNAPKNVCGQFKPAQLRTYALPQQSIFSPMLRAFTVGSMLTALTTTAVYGQQGNQEQQIFELPIPHSEIEMLGDVMAITPEEMNQVEGKITDLYSGKAMRHAMVQIMDTDIQITTDDYGYFNLTIPEEYREKPFAVIIAADGFVNQQRVIIPDQLPTYLNISLQSEIVEPVEIMEMGEVEFIRGKVEAPHR